MIRIPHPMLIMAVVIVFGLILTIPGAGDAIGYFVGSTLGKPTVRDLVGGLH